MSTPDNLRDEFLGAVEDYASAKKAHDTAYEGISRYDRGYFLHRERREVERAQSRLMDSLDAIIDHRIVEREEFVKMLKDQQP